MRTQHLLAAALLLPTLIIQAIAQDAQHHSNKAPRDWAQSKSSAQQATNSLQNLSRFSVAKRGANWTALDPAGKPLFLVGINHLRDTVPNGVDRVQFDASALERVRSW